ncbi:Type 4 prepilin-like proteins leader peptide-processing enzyme [Beggiatoa sp. PS]|nr:Type 4 prepilin-like proteins leader peptide-processing enzyme [Beggiatoa sp. PS]
MNILTYLATEPGALLFVVGLLGLIVGSFLNVVIYRLPMMMEREWREQCAELLEVSAPSASEPFNLSQPRSRCSHCGHQITVLENIPILSFIWQRGQCTACQGTIAWRYPLVEALSAILAITTAWQFGFGWPLLGALFLTWAMLAASMIDFDHQLLPDNITLPFLWLGLLFNLFGVYTDIESSVIGAIVGYLSLWIVYKLFKWTTGKEGMGYGDFKLLAMLGAWLGWQALPVIILLSSLVGAIIGILLILLRGHDRSVPIPFGPYLAMAGWLSLLWGETLTNVYFLWIYP